MGWNLVLDIYPISSYTISRMSRKITLTTDNISQRQWSTLILELNNMSKSWKRFGVDIKISALNAERIIKWGNKSHDERDIRSEKPI
jgi:hypothetical protein